MIIKSIEMENFLSYYENNQLNFGEGPTLIIGQNNTGKSKLFDAFNWGLYDRAFNTKEERWETTPYWRDGLVNNFAKAAAPPGAAVTASVAIDFTDEQNNHYRLNRVYKIKRKSSGWDAPRTSSLSLSKRDRLTNNATDYFDIEAEEIIKTLFPDNLSSYFLFQGESISQIMSLNNKSSFTKALRDLSRIEIFEKAKHYSERVYRQLKKEYENKEDADKQIQEKKISLSRELEKLRGDLLDEQESFDNYCKERDTAKQVFERKNDELKKFQDCAKLLGEIAQLEAQRKTKIETRELLVENQKREIFDKWMYAGTDVLLRDFLDLYNQSKIERKIPEPIRQEFIRDMIYKEKRCLVCGTPAPDGSPEQENIKKLLNDRALDKETELINQLSHVADTTLDRVQHVKSEIAQFYRRRDEVDESLRTLQARIQRKEEDLANIKPSDVSDDELKLRNFTLLQKDRDTARTDLEKFDIKVNSSKSKLEYINKLLNEKQKDYDSLLEHSSNVKETERLRLSEKINETTQSFYETFLGKLIKDIEDEANLYFQKMTAKNKALSGTVKVDYDLKEVYTTDENQNRLHNINQANKVSLQISFVAAVLSVSNKFWSTYFPFIADAPISALGGNNKLTAIETMADIFNQSVIILKDDAVTVDSESVKNDLVRQLIQSESKIKNAYELKMSGTTMDEQHTQIIKIK